MTEAQWSSQPYADIKARLSTISSRRGQSAREVTRLRRALWTAGHRENIPTTAIVRAGGIDPVLNPAPNSKDPAGYNPDVEDMNG